MPRQQLGGALGNAMISMVLLIALLVQKAQNYFFVFLL
jgi:hypothetical protein